MNDDNILIDVLKKEIRWIGVTTKNRSLGICGSPSSAGTIFVPDDLINKGKSARLENFGHIGS